MSDRNSLLRAILDRPTDDTPRLVYADWLDDRRETEADSARCELIQLWYSLKPKQRGSARELDTWLSKHWRRLWPSVAAVLDVSVTGRLRAEAGALSTRLTPGPASRNDSPLAFKAWFRAGFAETIQFGTRTGYDRYWRCFAVDEPLARLGPLHLLDYDGTYEDDQVVTVTPEDWGTEVFDRLTGFMPDADFDFDRGIPVRHYNGDDEMGPANRAASAISRAMTARAREVMGLVQPAQL